MTDLLGMFRPRGRHHHHFAAPPAARHAAPRSEQRQTRRGHGDLDARDQRTMALFEQWTAPSRAVRAIVGNTLAVTKSIDAALQMTDLICDLAVAGGAR